MPTVSLNSRNQFVVTLSKDEVDALLPAAEEKSKKYTQLSPDSTSPYGFNHVHSHHVGMQAEHAAYHLLQWVRETSGIDLALEPIFQYSHRDAEADIKMNGTRIDVKCLSERSWSTFGPCISARQFDKLCIKAEVVLWAAYNKSKRTFTFRGFNYMNEVRELLTVKNETQNGSFIENYPVETILRDLEMLTSHEHVQRMKDMEPKKSARRDMSFYTKFSSSSPSSPGKTMH